MKYEIKCSEIKCTFAECDRSENGMNADGRKLIRLGLIDTCHLELTFTLWYRGNIYLLLKLSYIGWKIDTLWKNNLKFL